MSGCVLGLHGYPSALRRGQWEERKGERLANGFIVKLEFLRERRVNTTGEKITIL